MKILDLGCGILKYKGSIGIDKNKDSNADVISNLEHSLLPFKDNSFDLIICNDILEHLDDPVGCMEELHRVGKKNALVKIETPHFSSVMSWNDPTHKRHFTYSSFEFFTGKRQRTKFYSQKIFNIVDRKITFTKAPISWIPRLITKLSVRNYEHHWAWIFPAKGIHVTMAVEKD